MKKEIINEYDRNKALDCIANVYDKLDAIKHELFTTKPYPGYLKEKVEPALHDMIVLNEIIQKLN